MLLCGGLAFFVVGLLVYAVLRLSFLLSMATLELAGNDAAGVLPALALCHLLLVGLHQTLRNGMELDRGGRDTLGVSAPAS
jgi:hypothetical protein